MALNDRIRELADQAIVKYAASEQWVFTDQELGDFAELIVRECIGILSRNNPCPPGTTIIYSMIQDEYFDKGWQVAVETKSNQIKKHFGVE